MPIKATTPKIAIAGAGFTGAYLYRLLRKAGYPIDIYDVTVQTRCGLSPCAWCFPLSVNRYHIGCGRLTSDARKRMDELDWRKNAPGSPQKVWMDAA
jgi:flavin-dependent dehydrogenase